MTNALRCPQGMGMVSRAGAFCMHTSLSVLPRGGTCTSCTVSSEATIYDAAHALRLPEVAAARARGMRNRAVEMSCISVPALQLLSSKYKLRRTAARHVDSNAGVHGVASSSGRSWMGWRRGTGHVDADGTRETGESLWSIGRKLSRNRDPIRSSISIHGVIGPELSLSKKLGFHSYTGSSSLSGAEVARFRAESTASSNAPLSRKNVVSKPSGPSLVPAMIDFLNASWTPFHATAEVKRELLDAGFEQLKEKEEWDVQPGGKYFFTRNMSSIAAFTVGCRYKPGNGFNVVVAHTDSPCLKLKPVSASLKSGFLNVGVQTYGGGIWHTWFDRDLSVAGRVLLRKAGGELSQKLVKVRRPIMRIPTLAIHLDRSVNTDGFKPNLEVHLAPVLATSIKSELKLSSEEWSNGDGNGNGSAFSAKKFHHSLLLEILAEELKCEIDEIVDLELNVCDTQPSTVGGARNEFIFSGRLDNLASSYCALRSLVDSSSEEDALDDEQCVRMVILFDNEEAGSNSAQGAGSPLMFHAMKRIARLLAKGGRETEGLVERAIQKSFLVSADMAHAFHPNYPERHEDLHQPRLNEGLVIKHNANQRYATTSVTSVLFREVARLNGIPTQRFVVRNDMGCGTTMGPILASGVGIRTVDVGMPQLSMHSVREMCGTADVDISYQHLKAFFKTFTEIDERLNIDD